MSEAATLRPTSPASVAIEPPYFWQRRRFWIWSFVLFIAAAIAFVACLPTTQALVQFQRVKAGMTEQEVIDLLGSPTAHFEYAVRTTYIGDSERVWLIGEINFGVYFREGKATGKLLGTDVSIARRVFPALWGRNLF